MPPLPRVLAAAAAVTPVRSEIKNIIPNGGSVPLYLNC